MQSVSWSNLAINVLLAGSLQSLWGMINALQMTLHLVGFNVILPASCQAIMASLISTTTLQLIPEEFLVYLHFWKIGTDEDPYVAGA